MLRLQYVFSIVIKYFFTRRFPHYTEQLDKKQKVTRTMVSQHTGRHPLKPVTPPSTMSGSTQSGVNLTKPRLPMTKSVILYFLVSKVCWNISHTLIPSFVRITKPFHCSHFFNYTFNFLNFSNFTSHAFLTTLNYLVNACLTPLYFVTPNLPLHRSRVSTQTPHQSESVQNLSKHSDTHHFNEITLRFTFFFIYLSILTLHICSIYGYFL